MIDLRLSIQQTYGAIGIESNPAQQHIESPEGDLQLKQPSAKMNFSSESPKFEVDSTEAFHAYAKGPHLEWNSYITGQMRSIFLKQLAEKVEEGNRMATITNSANAFAEIARGNVFKPNPVNYQPAVPGFDNVKISIEAGENHTDIEPSAAEIQYTPQKPDIQIKLGGVEVYLRQKNSIDISVTTYDIYS